MHKQGSRCLPRLVLPSSIYSVDIRDTATSGLSRHSHLMKGAALTAEAPMTDAIGRSPRIFVYFPHLSFQLAKRPEETSTGR